MTRVEQFYPLLLMTALMGGCGAVPSTEDTAGLATSLPDKITEEIKDPKASPTPAPEEPKAPDQTEVPQTLAIQALAPIAANTSTTIKPVITAAEAVEWTQISGPGVITFSSKKTSTTTVSASTEGLYVLGVTATDSAGKKVSAQVNFTWDKTPPVISSMANVLTNVTHTLQPTVTGATRYTWSKAAGPGTLVFTTPAAASTGVSASEDGSYVARLTAADDAGNTAVKLVNFVWDTSSPQITPLPPVYTQSVAFLEPLVTGATTYAWTRVSGPGSIAFSQPTSRTTMATATVEGAYVLRLTVQDPVGNVTSSNVDFYRDTLPPVITPFQDVVSRAAFTMTPAVVGGSTYSWLRKSGPGTITFGNQTSLNTPVTASTEGLYVLTFKATDQAGNVATADVNFTWDTTPPVISPINPVETRTTANLSATVTGASTYAWSKVSGPGVLNFSAATSPVTTVSASADGTYQIRFTATDAAGNSSISDTIFIWDTTAPVITPMSDVASRTTAALTATVSGAVSYQWATVSGPGTLSFDTPQALSTNVTATVDGTYVLRLTATDSVGNSSSALRNFVYDTVPPDISPVSSILTRTFIPVSPTVTGATRYAWTQKSGPGSLTFTAPFAATSNVSASTDGSYVMTFTAWDAVNNTASRDITFVWDTTAPVSVLSNRPPSVTSSGTYNMTVSSVSTDFTQYRIALIPSVALCSEATYGSPVAAGTALAGTLSGEGTYTMCVLAGDPADNWQPTATSYTWTFDSTPPSITLAASFDANAAKTVAATVVGATTYAWSQISGPGTVTFTAPSSMSTSVTANTEGAYTLQLRATDAAGNVATTTTIFTWDVTPPVITAMSSITTNASFTLSPTITGATTYTWSKVSGSGTVTFGTINAASTTVAIAGDTTYVLRITATDAANNSATSNVTVVYDTVAPVVGTLAAFNVRTTTTLAPTVTGATLFSWTMQSGPGVITFGTPAAASTTASASLDGAYVLRLSASDAAGNTSIRDVTFNWDTVAPTITGMPTTVYANVEKTIATTVSGATTLAWSKTGGSAGTITFTPANAATSAVRSSAQGTFTLQLLASDAAGNQTTATTQFIWDTVVPTAPTLSAAGATQVNGPFTVTATLNESVQGLDLSSNKIVLTNGTLTAVSPSSTTATTSYSLSITPTATPVTLQLLAGAVQDLSGNSNTAASTTLSLVYDPTPPVAPEAAAPTANVMVDGIGYNTALIKWFWASDTTTAQSAIKYYVSYSTSSSFDTAAQVMAGTRTAAMAQSSFATQYGCYTTPSTGTSQQCSYHLTGLQAQTTYFVNVVAEDLAGNRSVYSKGTFTTLGLQPVFKKIAASQTGNSACGLAESGIVYCWGDNSVGTLGDSSQISKSIPTAIDSSFRFVDVAVGTNHACALRDNGTAYCWGAGANGQIGNSANSMALSPTLVGSGSQIFTSLVAGDKFTCALQDDGRASCWGANSRGELANGNTTDTNAPAAISGTLVFRKLAAGSSHVCGIKDDGLVFCWGYNLNGQTGTNTSGAGTDKTTATQITGTLKFRDIALGSSHSCGITGNGSTYCWGKGTLGQIGNNAAADVAVATLVNGSHRFISLAATAQSSCGIKDDGTLRCWGDNTLGELNTAGAQASSLIPVASSDTNRWISLIAGNSMFCGVQSSGTSYCWGSNGSGQLGVGDSINRSSSAAITMTNVTTPTLIKFKKIVVGDVTSCGLSTTQDLWCWGNGVTTGEHGVGARIFMKTSPLHVGSSKWIDMAMASNHACAINDAYDVFCWGRNAAYELGIASGDAVARYSPTRINGTRKYLSIATANNSSCAAATDGQLVCWGSDAGSSSGNLASGAYAALQVPTASSDTTNQYMKVAGGDFHSCGVTVDGSARCWGRNTSGQLGNGGVTNQPSPVNFDSSNRFVAIAAGAIHSCGITAAGVVRCFGAGANGQMGNGTITATNSTATTPTWSPAKKVLGQSWSGAAMDHSCVTTSDYFSYCWGANGSKQSNNSATNPITTPQIGNSTIISTSAGTTVSCQLSSQSDISCFGACDNGRCGQATPGTNDSQTSTGIPLAVKVSGI